MSEDLFPTLPDRARLWAYVADRPLTEQEQNALQSALSDFFETWTSHGRPVEGASHVLSDRLLLVGAAVPGDDVSGCGIDASVNVVEAAAARLELTWLSPLNVFYRASDGTVQSTSRSAFRKLAQDGAVTTETPVIDVAIDSVGALHAGALEQPAGRSWHARVFDLPQPAA